VGCVRVAPAWHTWLHYVLGMLKRAGHVGGLDTAFCGCNVGGFGGRVARSQVCVANGGGGQQEQKVGVRPRAATEKVCLSCSLLHSP
jgi:hypothetical protein